MWRWTALVFLIALHKLVLSQPITDDSNSDRAPRQLDFEECCPCSDQSDTHHDTRSEEPLGASSEGMLARTRDVGDCPCRLRDADPQGAASVFFPTAVRAAGAFLRPSEKKEDLKPIFNPEVDLASSVLQTLREATDEEYQEALARDAAKSATRASDDILFGDAIPQESANIVTIVVNPKVAEDDDILPEASHIQHSRCIHPVETARTNFGKMRMTPKSNFMLHKPKLAKVRPRLLHRNSYDMDSDMGASNIHEQTVSVDNSIPGHRTNTLPIRINTNAESGVDDNTNCNKNKVPDLRSALVQKKLEDFDLTRPTLLQSIRDKTISSLSRVPKFRLRNHLPSSNFDLSAASSNANEVSVNKIKYLRNSSPLEGIKQRSGPLSITNLLNLRDVELLPAKKIVNDHETDRSGSSILTNPIIRFRSDIQKDELEGINEGIKDAQLIPKNNVNHEYSNDPEGSSSNLNLRMEQVTHGNCDDEKSGEKLETHTSNAVSEEINEELPKVVPNEETDNAENQHDAQDSLIDASNFKYNIIEPQEREQERSTESLEKEKSVSDEICDQGKASSDSFPTSSTTVTPKFKLLDPIAVDKTLSTIKENIAKKLEDLKNIKTNILNKNILDRNTDNRDNEKKDDPIITHADLDQDCRNEESIQVATVEPSNLDSNSEDGTTSSIITTTFKPDTSEERSSEITTTLSPNQEQNNDYAEGSSECDTKKVSLQDLKTISDSMLQQDEQERASKGVKYDISSENFTTGPLDKININTNLLNTDNTPVTSVVDSENVEKIESENNENNYCNTDLPKSSLPGQTDTDVEASDVVFTRAPIENSILRSQPVLQPTLNVLSLPSFDDIKDKITNLFDGNDKEEFSNTVIKPDSDSLDMLHPVMDKGASLSNFQFRSPSSRLFQDVNFDILELQHPPSILPSIPKLGFHSYKTKLPMQIDLGSKPLKLQSAVENKRGLLSAALSIGENRKRPTIERTDKRTSIAPNKTPNVNAVREQLIDSSNEATNNIYSTIKKSQRALESRFRKVNKNLNRLKSPPNLLETISKHHDDMNDKLRALHLDFNDRIESMRNELIDRTKLFTSGSRNVKPILRSSSSLNKQNKNKQTSKHSWQASSGKTPQKSLVNHRLTQKKPSKIISSVKSEQKKFRMPAAASVPIPQTVDIPELRATSARLPSPTLKKGSSIMPYLNVDTSSTKEPLEAIAQQTSSTKSHFKTQIKPKKDNKITVSFSTTPRPAMVTGHKFKSSPLLQNRNTQQTPEKFRTQLTFEDHRGSPSEIRQLKIPAPRFEKNNNDVSLRNSEENDESKLQTSKLKSHFLQSWPRASEVAFLSKVKEAVQTRLSKVNSPETLKRTSLELHGQKAEQVMIDPTLDMARAASEKDEIVDKTPLIENVSYKCKMVCTKD